MTILACVDEPGFRLIVCGSPSREWLEWLRGFDGPLSASQLVWRQLGEQRRAGELPSLPDAAVMDLETEPGLSALADNSGPPDDSPPARLVERRRPAPKTCAHRYICDQCQQCERCDCYDCPL